MICYIELSNSVCYGHLSFAHGRVLSLAAGTSANDRPPVRTKPSPDRVPGRAASRLWGSVGVKRKKRKAS
jgi:hypothetical protein